MLYSMLEKLFFLTLTLVASLGFSVQAQANTYDFKNLKATLGYSQNSWFGATQEEIQSLEDYTNKQEEYYAEINLFLRFYPKPYEWYGKGPEQAKVDVQNIDNIFTRVPDLPTDLILFRGVRLDWKKNKSFKIGETFLDKAFISTSTNIKIADEFTYGDTDNGAAIYVLYFNQPHSKGILIDQGEDEVLLQHGQKFKVMDKTVTDDKTFYLVQVCGFSPCSQTVRQASASAYWNEAFRH